MPACVDSGYLKIVHTAVRRGASHRLEGCAHWADLGGSLVLSVTERPRHDELVDQQTAAGLRTIRLQAEGCPQDAALSLRGKCG